MIENRLTSARTHAVIFNGPARPLAELILGRNLPGPSYPRWYTKLVTKCLQFRGLTPAWACGTMGVYNGGSPSGLGTRL